MTNYRAQYTLALLVIGFALAFHSCSTSRIIQTNSTVDYSVTSAGIAKQGMSILNSWGFGENRALAIEDAKKNALQAMLFTGIPDSPDRNPIIRDPNKIVSHEQFFEKFFSEDGEYKRFATIDNDGWDKIDTVQVKNGYNCGVMVVVNRTALLTLLETNNIIREFGM